MLKWMKRVLPHLTIVLAFMVIIFFVIDRINRSMAFMTSEMSKWLFMVFAVLVLPVSVMAIASQWREDAREARREMKQRAREQQQADSLFLHHQHKEEFASSQEETVQEHSPSGQEEPEPREDESEL
jgi:ABC-type nickel/cobalt efflux system permease component RcnA